MTHYIEEFDKGYRGELTDQGRKEYNCIEFCKWYENKGKELYLKGFKQETGSDIQTSPNHDNLVANGVPKSFQDLVNKERNIDYYRANAFMFLDSMDDITKKVNSRKDEDRGEYINQLEANYLSILKNLCANSIGMLNDWKLFLKEEKPDFSTYLVKIEHTFNIFQAVRQSIFGRGTDFSFNDLNIYSSVAVLRTAIELRIRRAFGINGQIDSQGNHKPLNLSNIFEVIKKHKEKIEFVIPLQNIERVYKWANIFMHAGTKQYIWTPLFLSKYMAKLFVGSAKYRNQDSGIILDKPTMNKIWKDLDKSLIKDVPIFKFRIFKYLFQLSKPKHNYSLFKVDNINSCHVMFNEDRDKFDKSKQDELFEKLKRHQQNSKQV